MTDPYATRQTLLQRAVNPDDEAAWQEFVGYYKTFIFMLLRNINTPISDCEDLTQNILVKIWKKLETYDAGRAKFRTWLSAVIRNEALSHFDKLARQKNKHTEFYNHLQNELQHSDEFDKRIEQEWAVYITNLAMQRVKEAFSGNAIRVFELTLDEVPVEEIAEQLGIKVFTVYALRNRVKNRLKEEVANLRQELEL